MKTVCAVLLLAGAWLAAHAAAADWTASWGAALMPAAGKAALPAAALQQASLRQTMRLSLGGEAVRVRISNLYGAEPLVIGAASVGRPLRPGAADLTGKPLPLRFKGADTVTVAPGAEIASDPLALPVAAGDALALTLFVVTGPARQSVHLAAHASQFIAPGDQTGRTAFEGGRTLTTWYQVAGIDVLPAAAPAGVLVAIGDSITDGTGAGLDADERWTDFLSRRLRRAGAAATAVINAGIGGNRMLKDDIGPHLLSRFERDALDRPGVTHALVLIGVNDLGRLHKGSQESPQTRQAMLAELQVGWRQLARQAHARGVCLLAGTLTPYGGSRLYQPTGDNEADRQALNAFLRGADFIDGVADFDAAVRDPAAPGRLLPAYDSGDGLHLSPAGYRAMAAAVPAEMLGSCRWAAAGVSVQPVTRRFAGDPSPHYFPDADGGGFYLYATDDASNSGSYWDSTAWRLTMSKDMHSWRDAGAPLDVRVFKWARPDAKAWAPDAVYRNGKYYFYAPVGGDRIGVAVASSPGGPFVDARTDALVDKARDPNAGAEPIDPAVFVDRDGQAYLYFGTRVPKVVKLKADMVSLDGPIRDVVLEGLPAADPKKKYGEAPFQHERGGIYYFSFSSGWPGQILYATAASPLGPFTYRGVVLDYLKISTNHQAILEHDGKSWLFYHDKLLPGGGSHRRAIAVAPLEYEADGRIRQVVPGRTAVSGTAP